MASDKVLYFDTETTGLDSKKCGIVQIAGYIEIDGEVKEEFDLLMSPTEDMEIQPEALEVIGKTKEELFNYPNQSKVFKIFKKILSKYVFKYNKNDKFKLVAHNIQFDFDFLIAWAERNDEEYLGSYINFKEQYCTFRVFQALRFLNLIKSSEEIENNKLQTICDFLNINLFDAHDAMNDVRATRELYLWQKGFLNKILKLNGLDKLK